MEKYTITLTSEERTQLEALVSKGKHAAQKVVNALILLNCDTSIGRVKRPSGEALAEILQIGARKIDRVKRVLSKKGLRQS